MAGGNPLSAAFSGTVTPSNCSGTPTFAWTFGDGGTSAQQNPVYTYAAGGTYAWTLTVTQDGASCVRTGVVSALTPPAVSSVAKAGNPFRVVILGSNFHPDVRVFIAGSEWATVSWKGDGKIVLKKGSALKALFPPGVFVPIRLLNGDGGEVTVRFDRGSGQWLPGA